MLLNSSSKVNQTLIEDGTTALMAAVMSQHLGVAITLLEHGANVNIISKTGLSPLMVACASGNLELVELLIQWEADITHEDQEGNSCLLVVCQEGHANIAKLLIDKGCKVDIKRTNDNTTPLLMAIQQRHYEVSQLLISYNANVNARNSKGATPLLMAASFGDINLVKLLLDSGAITVRYYCELNSFEYGSSRNDSPGFSRTER